MMRLLEKPDRHALISLSAVAPADRPEFFVKLMARLWDLRKRYGRPHWIVVNDAHLLMPAAADAAATPAASSGDDAASLPRLRGSVVVTSDPTHLARRAIEGVSTLVAAGPSAPDALRAFCDARGVAVPALTLPEARTQASADGSAAANDPESDLDLDRDRAILWRPDSGDAPRIFRIGRCRESRR
jgi:hypothetical protein